MCKEEDVYPDPVPSPTPIRIDGNPKPKLELNTALPECGRPPQPPQQVIKLPDHSTGMEGDSELMNKEELTDIDLSEISK